MAEGSLFLAGKSPMLELVADAKKPARDRDAILARRRFFVASAMAGVVVTACDRVGPQVCLEQAPLPTDAGGSSVSPEAESPPRPCLEIAEPAREEDAGAARVEDAGQKAPQPCLSVPRQPRDAAPPPTVCLKVAPPKKSDG